MLTLLEALDELNSKSESELVPKNKPCKRNNRQISDNIKIAAK